jgi:hypothetical protein
MNSKANSLGKFRLRALAALRKSPIRATFVAPSKLKREQAG